MPLKRFHTAICQPNILAGEVQVRLEVGCEPDIVTMTFTFFVTSPGHMSITDLCYSIYGHLCPNQRFNRPSLLYPLPLTTSKKYPLPLSPVVRESVLLGTPKVSIVLIRRFRPPRRRGSTPAKACASHSPLALRLHLFEFDVVNSLDGWFG